MAGLAAVIYASRVSTAKAELSGADATTLRFQHKDFFLERTIARSELAPATTIFS